MLNCVLLKKKIIIIMPNSRFKIKRNNINDERFKF